MHRTDFEHTYHTHIEDNDDSCHSLRLSDDQKSQYIQYEYIVHVTVSKYVSGRLPDNILDTDDLIQYGRIALVKAIKASKSHNTFKAFAISAIRNAISSAIRNTSDSVSIIASSTALMREEDDEPIQSEIPIDSFVFDYEQSNCCIDILLQEAEKYKGNKHNGIMCYVLFANGFSPKDIATALNVPSSSVYRWMHEAKTVLSQSKLLRDYFDIR